MNHVGKKQLLCKATSENVIVQSHLDKLLIACGENIAKNITFMRTGADPWAVIFRFGWVKAELLNLVYTPDIYFNMSAFQWFHATRHLKEVYHVLGLCYYVAGFWDLSIEHHNMALRFGDVCLSPPISNIN